MTSSLEKQNNLLSSSDVYEKDISWKPLVGGWANFKTRRLIQWKNNMIYIKSTIKNLIFDSIFIIIGLWVIFFLLNYNKDESLKLPLLLFSCVFILWWLLVLLKDLRVWYTLDLNQKIIYKSLWWKKTNLNQVCAIQILWEDCIIRKKDDFDKTYTSYEINLIFKNNSRINLMDYGNKKSIYENAQILSALLNIPIWTQNQE